MNQFSSHDFSNVPDYTKRRMFLDPAGRVTIQRYDEYAFPRLNKFDETQRGFFWVPDEITLTKDKIDFKQSNETIRHIFSSNLLRQTALDSIQGRSPVECFLPVCSVPELESLVMSWSFFETIHSRSYSHIIRNIYNSPTEEFNRIHDTQEIVQMAANIGKYYDDLYVLNSKKALGQEVTEYQHIKAVWLALVASYGLEAVRFMVSFATSLGMVENKIFIGNGNIISLILQDELLHTDWTAWIMNSCVADDERFRVVARDTREEAMAIYEQVINEEKAWADYLFKKGVVIGLNANIMKEFVDWTAHTRLAKVGVNYPISMKSSPLPWFNKHSNTNKKQTALQENESVSYVIGSMTNTIDYKALPKL
jgi:ribonucleoside-diphosphate reductase beta chain